LRHLKVFPTASKSSGYVVENSVCELAELRSYVLLRKVRRDQADTTVNVIAHAARTYHAFFIVCRCYTAYRETVTFMPVRQGN
jgi:hypothetical protein